MTTNVSRDRLIARVEELIEMGESVVATAHGDGHGASWVDTGPMQGFRSATLSFIERVYGASHSHYKEFSKGASGSSASSAKIGVSITQAIRDEIAGDWFISIRGLVTAEVFADFLEMADHLLETGYKDPAAVMGGSVLEEHLRQLCLTNGIDPDVLVDDVPKPKKADRLNADLAKEEVYSKLDQKTITAWLGLRNDAAHGQYDRYTVDQVSNMLSGITEFMARVAL